MRSERQFKQVFGLSKTDTYQSVDKFTYTTGEIAIRGEYSDDTLNWITLSNCGIFDRDVSGIVSLGYPNNSRLGRIAEYLQSDVDNNKPQFDKVGLKPHRMYFPFATNKTETMRLFAGAEFKRVWPEFAAFDLPVCQMYVNGSAGYEFGVWLDVTNVSQERLTDIVNVYNKLYHVFFSYGYGLFNRNHTNPMIYVTNTKSGTEDMLPMNNLAECVDVSKRIDQHDRIRAYNQAVINDLYHVRHRLHNPGRLTIVKQTISKSNINIHASANGSKPKANDSKPKANGSKDNGSNWFGGFLLLVTVLAIWLF